MIYHTVQYLYICGSIALWRTDDLPLELIHRAEGWWQNVWDYISASILILILWRGDEICHLFIS